MPCTYVAACKCFWAPSLINQMKAGWPMYVGGRLYFSMSSAHPLIISILSLSACLPAIQAIIARLNKAFLPC